MKINQWTLGLAAVGLVSLSSVVSAEEASSPLLTAFSSTTISGYVDVAAQWNPGSGAANAPYSFGTGKQDGFNVNAVDIKLEKPLAEGEWATGYVIEGLLGADSQAVTGGATSGTTEYIRQAYVAMRAPVGNGLDLKLGRFDTILGYESTDGYKNPNYTRSYGYTSEATEFTGVLASYQVSDLLSFSAGVANAANTSALNDRTVGSESRKAYLASVTLTAPESTGFLAGSALYLGVVTGDDNSGATPDTQNSFYVGGTIATPVEGLRLGAAFDYINQPGFNDANSDAYTVALYASFKASDKLSFHARGEFAKNIAPLSTTLTTDDKIIALTGTVQYDIWENILTRLEVRWDHAAGSTGNLGGAGTDKNEVLVAANLIYKF